MCFTNSLTSLHPLHYTLLSSLIRPFVEGSIYRVLADSERPNSTTIKGQASDHPTHFSVLLLPLIYQDLKYPIYYQYILDISNIRDPCRKSRKMYEKDYFSLINGTLGVSYIWIAHIGFKIHLACPFLLILRIVLIYQILNCQYSLHFLSIF